MLMINIGIIESIAIAMRNDTASGVWHDDGCSLADRFVDGQHAAVSGIQPSLFYDVDTENDIV